MGKYVRNTRTKNKTELKGEQIKKVNNKENVRELRNNNKEKNTNRQEKWSPGKSTDEKN